MTTDPKELLAIADDIENAKVDGSSDYDEQAIHWATRIRTFAHRLTTNEGHKESDWETYNQGFMAGEIAGRIATRQPASDAGKVGDEQAWIAARGDGIETDVLEQQLSPFASKDCRECDGTGVFYGNVCVCACVISKLETVGAGITGWRDENGLRIYSVQPYGDYLEPVEFVALKDARGGEVTDAMAQRYLAAYDAKALSGEPSLGECIKAGLTAAMPTCKEVTEQDAERVLDAYVGICIDQHSEHATKEHRIAAMREALASAGIAARGGEVTEEMAVGLNNEEFLLVESYRHNWATDRNSVHSRMLRLVERLLIALQSIRTECQQCKELTDADIDRAFAQFFVSVSKAPMVELRKQLRDAIQSLNGERPSRIENRKDVERLDWLEQHEARLVSHRERSNDEYTIWWCVTDRSGKKSISGHPLGNPRAAIDAAIDKARKGNPDGRIRRGDEGFGECR